MVLGWQTSSEKEGGFDAISSIQINLADAYLGVALVHNVESRVCELVLTIDGILAQGALSAAEMMVRRGRLVFAEAQIFGRLAGAHMKERRSLVFLRDRVLHGEPGQVLSDIWRVYRLISIPMPAMSRVLGVLVAFCLMKRARCCHSSLRPLRLQKCIWCFLCSWLIAI